MIYLKWFVFALIAIPIIAKDNIDLYGSAQARLHPFSFGPQLQLGIGIGSTIMPYRITKWLAPSLSLNGKINYGISVLGSNEIIPTGSIYIGNIFRIISFHSESIELIPAIGIKTERVFDSSLNYLSFSIASRILTNTGKLKCSFSPYLVFDRAMPFHKYAPQSSNYENGLFAYEVGLCFGIIINKPIDKK